MRKGHWFRTSIGVGVHASMLALASGLASGARCVWPRTLARIRHPIRMGVQVGTRMPLTSILRVNLIRPCGLRRTLMRSVVQAGTEGGGGATLVRIRDHERLGTALERAGAVEAVPAAACGKTVSCLSCACKALALMSPQHCIPLAQDTDLHW
eukprot:6183290-Pleurochrysis_carterae.AAC.8